jgi:hypothetical protein
VVTPIVLDGETVYNDVSNGVQSIHSCGWPTELNIWDDEF